MEQLGHGANVVQMAARYGKNVEDIIDFSSNINPYTMPDLEKYLEGALDAAVNYPDIEYIKLRTQIGDYLGVPKEQIIVGNGATEIMYLLMKSLSGRLAIIHPTFSEYERSAKLSGLEVVDFYYDKNQAFKVPYERVKENIHTFDALFICNPNNPTAMVQELSALVALLSEYNKWLIVDETFMEFVAEEDRYSLVPYIKTHKNIIIIKAITKFFGLPGLRLGYGICSNEELMAKMQFYKEPWTVNTFAEQLTGHMLSHKEYIEASKDYFIEERQFMLEHLRYVKGIKVHTTDTNFILIKLHETKAADLKERLFIKYNLLIRDASNFKGLDDTYIRVAIKTREENELLINALIAEQE